VLITNGNQQAITLAASLTLVPGGVAFVENPSSPGVLDAFRGAHADIRPVQVLAAGIDVDALEGLARRYPPRAIYLTPTFQSPTGAVMPHRCRQRVARLAIELQTIIIEDLGPASLALGNDRPPASLARYAPDHTITIGSMSKLYWAGLRTGWIRGPAHLIGRAGRLKAATDLGSPLISQAISARLLARHDEVQQARREYLLPRLERMTSGLAHLLPDWTYARPAGGLVLWVRIPSGNAAAFAQVASRHGVVFVPGSLLSADEGHQDHLRLAFGLGRAEIDDGVERLAAAWGEYEPHADPQPALIGSLT
jgi:DNA-binding transcriptional MocR family regulator